MKVVHLSYTYSMNNGGGAAIAASRLHEALIDAGVESHFVCLLKNGEGRNVHVLPKGRIVKSLYFILAKALRAGWKLTPFRKGLSTNLIPLPGLRKLLDEINPDVVHVHWINYGVASQESLARLPYPIIVNLHDLWPIDALNFYPGLDRRFITGLTRQNSNWMERWMIRRKRKFAEDKNVTFIGPSEWVAEMCRQSVVGRGLPAYAIPNVIDPVFRYDESLVRQSQESRLGGAAGCRTYGVRAGMSPQQKCVFLFGCDGGTHNQYKGFDDVSSALTLLPSDVKKKMLIRVFGQSKGPTEIAGVSIECLGMISSPLELKKIYHAADVFLFPSKQETQGMTKVEAMLCGLPVIAFDRTACAEWIVHGRNGWVIIDGKISDFAKAMAEAVAKKMACALPLHASIAHSVQNIYSCDRVLKRIRNVYEVVAENHGSNLYVCPILQRFGLGNKLLIWARAEAFAADHGAKILKPSFTQLPSVGAILRGERTWRTNFGNFDLSRAGYIGGFLRGRILKRLPHITETAWTPEFRDGVVTFEGIGHDSFGAVLRHHDYIVNRLKAITHPKILKSIEHLAAEPFIGVHVRRGDFRQSGVVTDDAWFLRAIRAAIDRVGHIPIRVFSDGRPEELTFIRQNFPKDHVVIMSSGKPIRDIWALSKSQILVGSSRSSFSIWSVLLGQMPSIWAKANAPTARDLYIDARQKPVIL